MDYCRFWVLLKISIMLWQFKTKFQKFIQCDYDISNIIVYRTFYQFNHFYLITRPITNLQFCKNKLMTTFYGWCSVFSPLDKSFFQCYIPLSMHAFSHSCLLWLKTLSSFITYSHVLDITCPKKVPQIPKFSSKVCNQ